MMDIKDLEDGDCLIETELWGWDLAQYDSGEQSFTVYGTCLEIHRDDCMNIISIETAKRAPELQAENERLTEHYNHMRSWLTQDQSMLSSRQIADAVIRMLDDALIDKLKGGEE